MRVLSLEEMELVSGAGKKHHAPKSGSASSSKSCTTGATGGSSSSNCCTTGTGGSSSSNAAPCPTPTISED